VFTVNRLAGVNVTRPIIGPRIGTLLSRKATAPHSMGSPNPQSRMASAVASPTAAFMIVTVMRAKTVGPKIPSGFPRRGLLVAPSASMYAVEKP
jgi:hypothetical protein